ncbi:MAG TPA: ankyrin repeat domain-containing protein [Thermoanaerobaculia bacterium]|nr:ankyrin repeat domain-containing protein [Thermoanaerobaculia bacterium]
MNIIILALLLAATPNEFIQAVRTQDAAQVQSMLEADPSLANAKSEKGRSAVTLAMFALVNNEGFMRPAKNPMLQSILARHPKLDLWETAALGTPDELAKMLKGRQVNELNDIGWTPLHYAGFAGNAGNVKVLLDRGADMRIRAKTKFRNSPFLAAMLIGDYDTIKLFLDRGADVLERQGEGDTALHEAAAGGDFEMVKLLVERGSDIGARDDEGKSPLDYAVERKHAEVADFLRAKGVR